jgi:hypothetical protein
MKTLRFASLLVSLVLALPAVAEAQVVVRTSRRGHRIVVNPLGPGRVVVGPRGGSAVVVNPPGPGNRTVVRVGPRGNTVVNPPGPGRVVIRH